MRLTDTLAALEANARHLARHAPTADREIRRAISASDGYPTTTSVSREPGTSELTSVEAAVERRLTIGHRNDRNLADMIAQAEQLTARLVALVNSWLPNPERASSQRCSGGGSMPGAMQWGRPECDNIASRRGLCDACYMRMQRWRNSDDGT
jgi:hypothetical protein